MSLEDLARVVPSLPGLAERFFPHPTIPGACLVSWRDQLHAVTFDRAVFDAHSDTVRLLTYGEPLLAALLETVAAPATGESTAVVRMAWEGDPPLRGYYRLAADRFEWLDSLATLEQALDDSATAWSPEMAEAAQRDFARRCAAALKRWEAHVERLQSLLHSQLAARGRRLLVETALVEIALGRRQESFESTYPISFGPGAVAGLRRHGYPFAPLIRLVGLDRLAVREDDPLWEEVSCLSVKQLKGRWH